MKNGRHISIDESNSDLLQQLTEKPDLTSLSLVGLSIGDGTIEALSKLQKLQALTISKCQLSGSSFEFFDAIGPGLDYLMLHFLDCSAVRLDGLGSLSNLRSLSLVKLASPGNVTRAIPCLPSVKEMRLDLLDFEKGGFTEIGRTNQLVELYFQGSTVFYSDIAPLASLKQLKIIYLEGTQVLDAPSGFDLASFLADQIKGIVVC